jgi:hypothetical protein
MWITGGLWKKPALSAWREDCTGELGVGAEAARLPGLLLFTEVRDEYLRLAGKLMSGLESARMWRQIAIALLFSALWGCGAANSYTVVERTNDQNSPWVKVVLLHDGEKIYANCNNDKAGANGKTEGCKLYVGETLQNCDFSPDPLSHDSRGYNLICGNELTNGKLDTTAGNELLLFEKEEQTGTQNYGAVVSVAIPVAAVFISLASFLVALSALAIARKLRKRR